MCRADLPEDPETTFQEGYGIYWYLSRKLDHGLPLSSDEVQRLSLVLDKWQASADQGYAPAQFALGTIFEKAHGVAPNFELALTYYIKAAEQELPTALYNMAMLYQSSDRFVERDDEVTFDWCYWAADKGHVLAQCHLGCMYQEGVGVKKNLAEAVHWWIIAAEAGNAMAQCYLGVAFIEGRGVGLDEEEALRWFRISAEGGSPVAEFNIGAMHLEGRGGLARDENKALWWFHRAADHGDAGSMCSIGLMNYKGSVSCPRNGSRARAWLVQAKEKRQDMASALRWATGMKRGSDF